MVAIARSAFLQIQEESCVRSICCDALIKQIVSSVLAINRLGRDAVLFSPASYGIDFGTNPGGDEAGGPFSPAVRRGLALLLQYNQLNTNINAAFKIAGCTGFCPPDVSDLPAQVPASPLPIPPANIPPANISLTGYPYNKPLLGGEGPSFDNSLFLYAGENNCV